MLYTMAKYVIHKIGFFYTDECFAPEEGRKGSVVGSYNELATAKEAKKRADIDSMRMLAGMNAVDFFFDSPNYDAIYDQLANYYQQEYGLTIEDKYYFNLPDEMNERQARQILSILEHTFHQIVEYNDDEEPVIDDLAAEELGEF